MLKPQVCVLRAAGTNCDQETAFAFQKADACAELVHVNRLIAEKNALTAYHILAIPGGFTYGDDVAAGKILANELKYKLIDEIKKFIAAGKLIIGICNGFQILVKAGLLPGNAALDQEASLILNDSAKFEDRWVYLKVQSAKGAKAQKCVWVEDLPELIYLPVAHGEGKFVTQDKGVLRQLEQSGQIVFQYCDEKIRPAGYPYNPNGSEADIAGICDATGRILGLMPHPERHIQLWQHPRGAGRVNSKHGDGFQIFKNGVEYVKEHF